MIIRDVISKSLRFMYKKFIFKVLCYTLNPRVFYTSVSDSFSKCSVLHYQWSVFRVFCTSLSVIHFQSVLYFCISDLFSTFYSALPVVHFRNFLYQWFYLRIVFMESHHKFCRSCHVCKELRQNNRFGRVGHVIPDHVQIWLSSFMLPYSLENIAKVRNIWKCAWYSFHNCWEIQTSYVIYPWKLL